MEGGPLHWQTGRFSRGIVTISASHLHLPTFNPVKYTLVFVTVGTSRDLYSRLRFPDGWTGLDPDLGHPLSPSSRNKLPMDETRLEDAPPPSIDFTRLCGQWKEITNTFGASIWPHQCDSDRQCDGCQIISEVSKNITSEFASAPRRKVRVFLKSHTSTRASFLLASIWDMPEIAISSSKDMPNPWNLIGRPSVLLEGFGATMDLVRHWLDRCIREHQGCGVGADSQLPTRVLSLGSCASDPIRLHESNGGNGRYICLTYCWGKSEFLKTTRGTLESRKQSIDPNKLPQTFRDTVQIARALGIQYIWIDSLCIIQDDAADWRRESSRMADVYRLSYLTVGPSWADTPDAGCFTTPDKGLEVGTVTARVINHFPNTAKTRSEGFKHYPLLSRAWTYQERMLSPRILYFGKQELLWDCREERTCECGMARYHATDVDKAHFHDAISNPGISYSGTNIWRQMVAQYTPLQLTYRSDKLPAFSGLAAEMQRSSKQEYLAGLWTETLIPDMCWMTRKEDNYLQPGTEASKTCSPETLPQTPTWSWASVDGPVTYPEFLYSPHVADFQISTYLTDDKVLAQPTRYKVEESGVKASDCPDVLAVQPPLLNTSTPGQVQNGFIELRCCLIPAEFIEGELHIVGSAFRSYTYTLDRGRKIAMEDGRKRHIIPMLTDRIDFFYGLIVQQKGLHPEEMIRIGLLWIPDLDPDPIELEKLHGPKNQRARIF